MASEGANRIDLKLFTGVRHQLAVSDAFGHLDYASVIADVVAGVDTPFTLGLFSPWGTGKTAILDEVAVRLAARADVAYVQFDVWRYEGTELRRQFLMDITADLVRAGRLSAKSRDKLTRDVIDDVSRNEPEIRWFTRPNMVLLAVRLAVIVPTVLAAVFIDRAWHNFTGSAWVTVVASVIAALVIYASTLFGSVITVDQKLLTTRRVEEPDRFFSLFKSLLQELAGCRRLVVAIDNLDRCSPGRVAEVLATIKTFLEPADEETAATSVMFVIAADDEALRRHLTAQELAASGGAVTTSVTVAEIGLDAEDEQLYPRERLTSSLHVPDDVRVSVDEYLRKFFTGVIRLNNLLQEDVQTYASDQLARSALAGRLSEAESDGVIDMVSSALRRNPRRINQFLNNLALRIRVIQERELSGHIRPIISDNVLMIAKLAVIEEEWPSHYSQLGEDPSLLRSWTASVLSAESLLQGVPRSLVSFLKRFADVTAQNVEPYLSLKQSRVELELPEYRQFVAALRDRDNATVEKILEGAGEGLVGEYARQLPGIYHASRTPRDAVSVLLTAVDAKRMGGTYPLALLRIALQTEPTRRLLRTGDLSALVGLSAGLQEWEQGRLRRTLVVGVQSGSPDRVEYLARLAPALAGDIGRLSEDERGTLVDAIGEERLAFEAYAPLAVADPKLVPDSAVESALDALDSKLDEPFDEDEPAFVVARAGFSDRERPETLIVRFVNQMTSSFIARADDAEGRRRFTALVTPLLRELSCPPPAAIGMVETLQGASLFLGDGRFDALQMVHSVQSEMPGSPSSPELDSVVDAVFEVDHSAALAYVRNHLDELSGQVRNRVLWQLGGIGSRELEVEPSIARAAREVIKKLPDTERRSVAQDSARRAFESDRFDTFGRVLVAFSDDLGSDLEAEIQRLLDAASSAAVDGRAPFLAGITFLPVARLSAGQRGVLGALMLEGLESGSQVAAEEAAHAFSAVEDDSAFSSEADSVVRRLLSWLDSRSNVEAELAQLDMVAGNYRRLGQADLQRLVTLLDRVIGIATEPDGRVAIARAVSRLRLNSKRLRDQLVDRLLAAEDADSQADANGRAALLLAADAIASQSGTDRKKLEGRLKKLRESGTEPLVVERFDAGWPD